jgi:hypothetical protein
VEPVAGEKVLREAHVDVDEDAGVDEESYRLHGFVEGARVRTEPVVA